MLNIANCTFFNYFGFIVFSYAVAKLLMRIFNNISTFYFGIGKVNFRKYGSWAVVTGCTDGIGKAYTECFAKRGLNVALISRSKEKLEEQSKQLEDSYSIHTKVIVADFTEPNTIYADIKNKLADLDIAVLVNNVGISYRHPEYFDVFAENEKNINDMISCNIMSVTKMSGIVLPCMVKRKGGVIINNASASGRLPTPLLTVYSATKAYVDFFSRSLAVEYKAKGIKIQSICPYYVSTKLSAMRRSLIAPTPKEYVASAIDTIRTQPVTNGCLIHNIQGFVMEDIIPQRLLGNLTLSNLLNIRKRAIAKIKRQEEAAAAASKQN